MGAMSVVVGVLCVASIGFAAYAWFRSWSDQRRRLDRRHEEMLERAMIFSWEVDPRTGEILSVAGNVEAVLGYTPEEFTKAHVFDIVLRSEPEQVVESYGFLDGARHAEVRARHRDGREVRLREVRLDDDVANSAGTMRGVSIDITELAQAKEALRKQAESDSLTGLANRSVIDSYLPNAMRAPDAAPVGLLLADLDRFKEINDTLGHPTGDRVLKVLADRFEAELSDLDVVARIGGDEFAFAIQADLTVDDVAAIGERIHQLATSPIKVDGLVVAVACSVGIALSPEHGTTYGDLMKHADVATYECKRAGGGVLVFAADPDELSMKRWRLLSEMSGAIDRGEFELFMQPKVSLDTREIVGVEGLARWLHPELGLLLPGDFLHAVEVAADYHNFTNEVLRQGIEFAASLRSARIPLNVAINLGSMSLLDRSLPSRLSSMLETQGLTGDVLTFELTELDALDKRGGDSPVLAELTGLGVRLSIDDFGTGQSSFQRLRALSVDEVKIDQSFIAGLGVVQEDEILVETIVRLCEVLGVSVVAEGVETLEQVSILQRLGCGVAQGYHFAKPMTQSDMLQELAASAKNSYR